MSYLKVRVNERYLQQKLNYDSVIDSLIAVIGIITKL